MSDRYKYYSRDKGSSRSTRDDSRSRTDERDYRERDSSRRSTSRRSRSRSPRSSQHSHTPDRRRDVESHDGKYESRSNAYEDELPAPPPPPRITKVSIDFSKNKSQVAPIKMSLGAKSKPAASSRPTIASVFNDDDDEDEPEEMPAEARMRMRNIGRETPTSAGPNSFGKTKQGFCDAKKVFEKNLKQALESEQKQTTTKFPQTIYKLKGP